MLSTAERNVLDVFRQYLVVPGEMLCFHGQSFQKHRAPLQQLTEKKLLLKERFKGGYSLTNTGFAAMKAYHPK